MQHPPPLGTGIPNPQPAGPPRPGSCPFFDIPKTRFDLEIASFREASGRCNRPKTRGSFPRQTPPTSRSLYGRSPPSGGIGNDGAILDMREQEIGSGNGVSLIRVQLRNLEELTPFAQNARVHNDGAIHRLAKIIREIGWTNPILVDGDGIVAGHKRRLAALSIYEGGGTISVPGGQTLPVGMVPVIDVTGWTEAQRRAYIIADNQTTLESGWDDGVLRLELSWLEQSGIDMELTGFDGEALALALGASDDKSETEPDDPMRVSLADRFGVPPFSVISARDGWWQDRKRAWLRLGIQSELGRGEGDINAAPGGTPMPLDRMKAKASPGGSPRPATNYGKTKARGDGHGRAVADV